MPSVCALAGCGGLGATTQRPMAPQLNDGQSRCKVAASQDNPLVTEWPSSEKANLEARLATGAVAVAFAGCSMKLLAGCRLPGRYSWRRTTISTDTIEINDADELFAKLPLGAASLEAELGRSGRLTVQTTVSGQLELDTFDAASVARDPACREATHVVGALSVGAFELRSGARVDGRAGVSGVGVGAARGEGVLRKAGVPSACGESSSEAPSANCRSPIQMFLRPLVTRPASATPEGTIAVRFQPPDADRPWDLVVGDRVLCRAPCDRFSDPNLPYAFRTEGGFLRSDPVEEIPDLRPFEGQAPLEVRTTPRDTGKTALGIVTTSVAGLGILTGTVLTATGCGGQSSGRCTAGVVTLPVAATGLVFGIVWIVSARSTIEVAPLPNPASFEPAARGQ